MSHSRSLRPSFSFSPIGDHRLELVMDAIAPPPADSTTIILQMTAKPGREEEFVGVAKDIMKVAHTAANFWREGARADEAGLPRPRRY